MNIYVVTEGDCEKKVYPAWIRQVNPNLTEVDNISNIEFNNFAIVSGGGYPPYLEIIRDAINDVNSYSNIDKLVIAIDSENMTRDEKFEEIQEFIKGFRCKSEICIIVQHFCLECWALGNKQIFRRKTEDKVLRDYIKFFDVRSSDPEFLPSCNGFNRAQFAFKYLRKVINDRFTNTTYCKENPKILTLESYFPQLKKRYEEQRHLKSIESFIDAFAH